MSAMNRFDLVLSPLNTSGLRRRISFGVLGAAAGCAAVCALMAAVTALEMSWESSVWVSMTLFAIGVGSVGTFCSWGVCSTSGAVSGSKFPSSGGRICSSRAVSSSSVSGSGRKICSSRAVSGSRFSSSKGSGSSSLSAAGSVGVWKTSSSSMGRV